SSLRSIRNTCHALRSIGVSRRSRNKARGTLSWRLPLKRNASLTEAPSCGRAKRRSALSSSAGSPSAPSVRPDGSLCIGLCETLVDPAPDGGPDDRCGQGELFGEFQGELEHRLVVLERNTALLDRGLPP